MSVRQEKKLYLTKHTSPSTGEQNDDPGLTIPGMDIDIDQAVKRMQSGLEVRTYVPQWDEDLGIELPDDFENWDRLDRLQWAAEVREQIAAMNEDAKQANQAPPPEPPNEPQESQKQDNPAPE